LVDPFLKIFIIVDQSLLYIYIFS